jgi:hypothetical protein
VVPGNEGSMLASLSTITVLFEALSQVILSTWECVSLVSNTIPTCWIGDLLCLIFHTLPECLQMSALVPLPCATAIGIVLAMRRLQVTG